MGADTIAGFALTQDAALRLAVSETGLGLQDAIAALTTVPAAALGISHRHGQLAAGQAADIVALTPKLNITEGWAAGRVTPSR